MPAGKNAEGEEGQTFASSDAAVDHRSARAPALGLAAGCTLGFNTDVSGNSKPLCDEFVVLPPQAQQQPAGMRAGDLALLHHDDTVILPTQ